MSGYRSSCSEAHALFVLILAIFNGVLTLAAHNVTTLSGSTVTLDCRPPTPTYSGSFERRFYNSRQGDQIYSQHPFNQNENDFPTSRYHKVGDYGLEIASVDWRDGGMYGCHFRDDDVHQFASVVIIESPVTEVSPAVVNDGDEVTMTCIVHFGAAKNTLLTSEQVPHLTMTFNNNELTSEARYTDGQPSVSRHSITRETRLRADREHSGKMLSCTVSTSRPAFTVSTDRLLHVRAAAYDVTITPSQPEYTVGDVITCSAMGFPMPTTQWIRRESPDDDVIVAKSNLTVTDEMMGRTNSWSCTAENELNTEPVSISLDFTVTAKSDEELVDKATPVSMVSVAIIAAGGFILLVGVIVIIIVVIVIVRRRRQRRGKTDADQTMQNLIYNPTDSERADTSQHKPRASDKVGRSDTKPAPSDKSHPVPKPRTASSSSMLDAEDMKGSTTSLDRNLESDVVRPRPRTRGSQQSLDDPSQPRHKPRSQERLDTSTDAVHRPQGNPRGSADGLADRSRPTPARRGSQESLDDIGRPKPRARASLDRSLDESDISQSRPNRPDVAMKPKKPATSRKDRLLNRDETETDV